MTEPRRGRPAATKVQPARSTTSGGRVRSTAAARSTPPDAESEPATARQPETADQPTAHPTSGRGLTIHVPFVTVTLGPQPLPAVPPSGNGRGTIERLAFYGGVVAMGALGALDWPVVGAIAAGTWVAQHTLPQGPRAHGSGPAVTQPTPTSAEG